MAQTIVINIQIDNVKIEELPVIKENIDEALKEYKNRRVTYSLSDMFGPPLPAVEERKE